MPGSLTVCEGVSNEKKFVGTELKFPHCMWGCIGDSVITQTERLVPSLYVRVYRNIFNLKTCRNGSLTVCEGVSQYLTVKPKTATFPHYMWGCIARSSKQSITQEVPSLYVRVYRKELLPDRRLCGSLIVCECISGANEFSCVHIWFPHCVWGYIGICKKGEPERVNSLTVCECISKKWSNFFARFWFPPSQ